MPPAWAYSGAKSFDSPDGAEYYSARGRDRITHLAAVTVPSPGVVQALTQIGRQPGKAPEDAVSLEFQIDEGVPRNEQVIEKMRGMIEAKVAARGLKIADNQETRIIVRLSKHDRGSTYRIRVDGVDTFVPNSDLNLHVSYAQSESYRYWTNIAVARLSEIPYRIDAGEEDVESYLLQQQEAYLIKRLDKMDIPLWRIRVSGNMQFGRSRLGIDGESL